MDYRSKHTTTVSSAMEGDIIRGLDRMGRRRTKRRVRRTRRRKQWGGKPPAYVFRFGGNAGFGSVVNVMIHAIQYAKEQGRDFYLKDEIWNGGPLSRWHEAFKTLTTYDPEKHGHEKNDGAHPKYDGMRGYSLSELHGVVKDILVLNDDLAKKAKDFTESIGGPYTSIYVRRGDKVNGCAVAPKEMEPMPADELLKECEMKDDGRKLFIMSDDYTVVDELRKALPSCKIFTLTPDTNRGLAQDIVGKFTPEERKKQSDELVTSMQVFLNGEKAYADNRSNLGRLLKVAKPDTVHLYPVTEHSKALKPETPIWPSWRELGKELV